MFNKDIGKI